MCSREQRKGNVQEPRDDICNSKILGLLHSTGTNSLTFCYGLNCIPPKFLCWSPNP